MTFSLVVVTWNCADALETLVASLNEHLRAPLPELVIVDNASVDDPSAAFGRWRGTGDLLRLTENRGFGAAANMGVQVAGGDAVVLINPDAWILDDSLVNLACSAVERDAIVGPRVRNPDGTIQPSASGPPTGVWPWIRAALPGRLSPPWVLRRTEPWRLERPVRVAWLTGSCIAAPKTILESLGPFDESLHMYAEDLDLGLRAGHAGVDLWFLPDCCCVVHVGDVASSQRYADSGLAIAAFNARTVLERHFGERGAHWAFAAERARLLSRIAAKRVLRESASSDVAALRALDAVLSAEPGGEVRS